MSRKILVIDDDESFLNVIYDILTGEGYVVTTLSDSTLAEEYIEKYSPDLMIIDIFMPKVTGFNLVENFKENEKYQKIPKVFLTCLDDDIERMMAKACGVNRYLTKPFDPEELVKHIRELL